jgi:type IV secretory pathway VirB10-like protein
MAEAMANTPIQATTEPLLRRLVKEPMGVIQKHLKLILYLFVAALLLAAVHFSKMAPKTPAQQAATEHRPPQPAIQDSTDNNVRDLHDMTAAKEHNMTQPGSDPGFQNMTPAQQAAAAGYGPNGQAAPCIPGQPCAQVPGGYALQQQQLSPTAQEQQQLAARDRELAYDSRFASNLAYTGTPDQPSQRTSSAALADSAGVTGPQRPSALIQADQVESASSLIAPRTAGDPQNASADPPAQAQVAAQHKPEVNIDSATGQPYVIYEGTTLDTVLMNRLDGDAPGPVKVLVSNPVYSHDRQHVLIPEGTVVLGEARKIGAAGFGQQRRMAVVFHRMIMPDGYSVDLDQFHGLGQAGEEGLKDKVNNHYMQIFGTSIALGVIAGAGQIEEGGGMISTSGSQAFATGASAGVSQSATTAFDRFLEIPPTITIREGHRVKVYFTQDMLLPAYENHTIPQTF